jgi:hypothetical protein
MDARPDHNRDINAGENHGTRVNGAGRSTSGGRPEACMPSPGGQRLRDGRSVASRRPPRGLLRPGKEELRWERQF